MKLVEAEDFAWTARLDIKERDEPQRKDSVRDRR